MQGKMAQSLRPQNPQRALVRTRGKNKRNEPFEDATNIN